MIAPLRQTPSEPSEPSRLREAHQFVAQTLLSKHRGRLADAPRIPAWQAWIFAGWTVLMTAFYFSAMLGWL